MITYLHTIQLHRNCRNSKHVIDIELSTSWATSSDQMRQRGNKPEDDVKGRHVAPGHHFEGGEGALRGVTEGVQGMCQGRCQHEHEPKNTTR